MLKNCIIIIASWDDYVWLVILQNYFSYAELQALPIIQGPKHSIEQFFALLL